jgi:hypothetical protein
MRRRGNVHYWFDYRIPIPYITNYCSTQVHLYYFPNSVYSINWKYWRIHTAALYMRSRQFAACAALKIRFPKGFPLFYPTDA